MPTNMNFTQLFWNVLFTLIMIYIIRWVSLKYEIPFMKDVVTYQVPAQGGK